MLKIKIVTKVRGFIEQLTLNRNVEGEFFTGHIKVYDTKKGINFLLARISSWRIFDFLGLFQVINDKEVQDVNALLSYNRFVKTNKPYILLLEQPMAPVHYSPYRMKSYLGKKRVIKYLDDTNLKKIVCISKACYESFPKYYGKLRHQDKITQIYPLMPDEVEGKCFGKILECLYISSDFTLKGGDDILAAFKNLKGCNLHLTIITQIKLLTQEQKDHIRQDHRMKLVEFQLSKQELNRYYRKANIFLYPTRVDSFGLVVLEAMKFGCVYLGTNIYAIKEMVQEGVNGFLIEPKYKYWNDENMLDVSARNQIRKACQMKDIDQRIVNFICERLLYLNLNRKEVMRMTEESFMIAKGDEFGEKQISARWNAVIKELEEKNVRDCSVNI